MLSFFHVDSYQGKETFDNTTFSSVWPGMPSHA